MTGAQRGQVRTVSRQQELDAALGRGEIPLVVGHGLFVVGGDALVYASCGMIDAGEHARVVATANAAVRAGDWACIWSRDAVHVDAYDQAIVVAGGASCVRAADDARVFAEDRAEITVTDDARAYCTRESIVQANGRSCVHASRSVRVVVNDDAVIRAAVQSWVAAQRAAIVGPDPEISVAPVWDGKPAVVRAGL